jgi:3-methyladenine DNA glycosylase/8-oxoguanine DNA glycosylase
MPALDVELDGPLDLGMTLAPLARGRGDRTIRLGPGQAWWATRTDEGPATLHLRQSPGRLAAEAFGPGADALLRRVPTLIGASGPADGLPTHNPLVTQLARRFPGVRLPRSEAVMDALVPAILEQKVTGEEAHRAWRGLVAVHGEPAPGPSAWGLRLPPAPETLARLPYYAYHPFGIERRRADTIRRVAARATWLEATVDLSFAEAQARLVSILGIGPWTAAEVAVRALGDPDAVSVGDFHLPGLVTWALAGEPRGDDARMLELLEPYRGHRAIVVRLVELGGPQRPRRAPRLSPRRIEAI